MRLSRTAKLFAIYGLPLSLALYLAGFLSNKVGEFPPLELSLFPILSISVLLLLIAARWDDNRLHYHWIVSIVSSALLFLSSLVLYGTPTTLGDIKWDNHFSISMISKFSRTWANVDFNFKGLSSHYPFYFHYLLGKFSAAFNLPPEWVFKQGALAVIYLAPVLSFFLLLKSKDPKLSIFIFFSQFASLYAAGGNFYLFQKPYELLVLFLLLPWYFYYLAGQKEGPGKAITGGIIGGILFGTYYYWFLPLGLSLPFLLLQEAREGQWRKKILYLAYLGLFFFLTSAPYTLPYLKDLISRGAEPWSGRHFISYFYLSHLYSFLGLAYLAGLLYIIYRRFIFPLLIGTLSWILLAYLFTLEKSPLLPHKTSPFLTLILLAGLASMLYEISLKKPGLKRVFAAFLFLFTTNPLLYQISQVETKGFRKQLMGFSRDALSQDSALADLLRGKVILTTHRVNRSLNPFRFVYFFLPTASIFAHPSALLSQRIAFLQLLSHSEDPIFVRWALVHNKFQRINFVWPKKGRYITLLMDQFPYTYPNSLFTLKIEFSPKAFSALRRPWRRKYRYLYEVKDIRLEDREHLGLLEKIIHNDFTRFKKIPIKERPIAEARGFKIYRDGSMLIFINENCNEETLIPAFFARYEPPEKEIRFDPKKRGAFYQGKCVIPLKLPEFEFSEVRLGQIKDGVILWEIRVREN